MRSLCATFCANGMSVGTYADNSCLTPAEPQLACLMLTDDKAIRLFTAGWFLPIGFTYEMLAIACFIDSRHCCFSAEHTLRDSSLDQC